MGRLKNGTICSKHDEIAKLAEKIQDLVDKCLEDGMNMEQGLKDKRDRIDELEEENRSLREELAEAAKHIQDLEEQLQDEKMERQA